MVGVRIRFSNDGLGYYCVFETNDKNDNLETLLHYRISELHKKHNITFYTEYNSTIVEVVR
jgi:hypothetical protein